MQRTERKPLFDLGQLVATPGALAALEKTGQNAMEFLSRQHHAGGSVLAATHVHLDHHNCLEVVIMKGRSKELRHLADHILSLRGVKHGQLVITSTGKELK